MVARTDKLARRSNRYHCNEKSTRRIASSNSKKRSKPSTMKIHEPEKENHLIEAIVFTTDFLSCTKKPPRGASWNCASGSAETVETNDPSSSFDNEDGWFGIKRRQLISYENAEDLTRKVDALFRRNRSHLSSEAAAEIRDDLTEDDDSLQEEHDDNDDNFFYNLQRRIDDATSTCPSTNPSLSLDELDHWYSSSWSSFMYYGSPNKTYAAPSQRSNSRSNSKYHRPQMSCPLPTTTRKDSSPRQLHDVRSLTNSHRHVNSTQDGRSFKHSRSPLSMPDLKSTDHHNPKEFPVIDLLPSPPTSFSSQNGIHREMIPPMDTAVRNENQTNEASFRKRRRTVDSRGRRRFGRKAREFWQKTKRLFRH